MYSPLLTLAVILLFVGIALTVLNLHGMILIFLVVLVLALFSGFSLVSKQLLAMATVFALFSEGIKLQQARTSRDFWFAKADIRLAIIATAIASLLLVCLLTPVLYGLGVVLGIFSGSLLGVIYEARQRRRKGGYNSRVEKKIIAAHVSWMAAHGLLSVVVVIATLVGLYS